MSSKRNVDNMQEDNTQESSDLCFATYTREQATCVWRRRTSSPKGNDRSPENYQVFLNSSQVNKKKIFQLVKGS